MKILITGARGQLGYHLQKVFADHELYLGDSQNLDITQEGVVNREVENFRPDVIIHAAAYTNVDQAETDRDRCWQVNVTGTRHIAQAARAVDAKLVAISTDYVFPGDKGTPYLENDTPGPLSYYGQTKLEAEKLVAQLAPKHFICRTSWLYGGPKPTSTTDYTAQGMPKNFVYTMLRVGKNREQVEVVNDQMGSPTYAQDVAYYTKRLIETMQYGVYHLTNSGETTWADFASEIFRLAGYTTKVNGISSADWAAKNPQATQRPAYSVLTHQHLVDIGLPDLRSWQEALADFLADYHE